MGVVDFWYLQKCHVNDSLVHTWQTGIILQSTLQAVQCILYLVRNKRCKDRDRLTTDKHRMYGADSRCLTSRTIRTKPAAAQRQNTHPFKRTVSLLAVNQRTNIHASTTDWLSILQTRTIISSSHLIPQTDRTPITHTVLILILILILSSSSSSFSYAQQKTPVYPPLGQCRPSRPSPSPQPFPNK
ncbi:hypothetical protein GGI42DRAFT_99493 [Trichoderma sp. SZMC 28013]